MGYADVAESREVLNKTIHDLREEQQKLAAENRELRQNIESKTEDLTKAVRGLHTALAQYNGAKDIQQDSLNRYVEGNEEEHKHAGYIDKDRAKHGRQATYLVGGTDGKGVRLIGATSKNGAYESGLLDDPTPRSEWHKELQGLVDLRSFVRAVQGRNNKRTPTLDRQIERHLSQAPGSIGKIFADVAGSGAEWIPDVTMPQFERELQLARRVESLFGTVAIPAGGSMVLPFLSSGLRPYKAGAATTDDPAQFTSSSLTTADRTFTAVKLAVRMQVDRDASEDSIIAAAAIGREELINALVDGTEDAIINGDTTATHRHTGLNAWNPRSRWGTAGLGGTGDHRRLWDGLIERAFNVSNTNDGGSSQTTAGFATAVSSMDSPHSMGDVIAITSPEYMLLKMLLFTEVLTVDKYGGNATVLSGELGQLLGKPIFISEFVDKEYNASGIFDNTTKTKTGLLVVNRARFKMGIRRGSRVEMSTDITRDVDNLVASERKLFHTFDSSTKKNVRYEFNLSTS